MAKQHGTVVHRQDPSLWTCYSVSPVPLKKLNISVILKQRFSELIGTGTTDFKGNLPVRMNERSRLQVFQTRLKGSVSKILLTFDSLCDVFEGIIFICLIVLEEKWSLPSRNCAFLLLKNFGPH